MAERGLIIQHSQRGPGGQFAAWADERGIPYDVIRRDLDQEPPTDPREVAWLAAFGARSSVSDTEPAWVGEQTALFGRAMEEDVPVLGVCFGAQQLAVALGAEMTKAEEPFIGWHEVESSDDAAVPSGQWFHHNYEAFSFPEGATPLATAGGYPSAFTYGRSLAVQFHPEATREIVRVWATANLKRYSELGVDSTTFFDDELQTTARENAFRMFDAWRERAAIG